VFKEGKRRSIAKTISWRVLATVTTMALVYIFTKELKMAATVGVLEVFLKMGFYFVHERAWSLSKFGIKEVIPKVIWFTGLSGSGKSTISEALYTEMKKKGFKVEHLDGDVVRNIFPNTGFDKEARIQHVKRVGFLASQLEKNGVFVIASFISPYEESRDFVRNLCDNFVEVHVSTPLEVCEQRDVKGLYAKARAGEIKNFTGINDPYETPLNPEVEIDTRKYSVEKSVGLLLKRMGG
jgi:adenylylsulfate kinase